MLDSISRKLGFFKNLSELCSKAGLSTNFLSEFADNPNNNSINMKKCEMLLLKLHEQEKQNLFSAASNAQFHKLYYNIKSDFLMEKYMTSGLPNSHVKLIIAARSEMFYLNCNHGLYKMNI